jgi:hypothetical protein
MPHDPARLEEIAEELSRLDESPPVDEIRRRWFPDEPIDDDWIIEFVRDWAIDLRLIRGQTHKPSP